MNLLVKEEYNFIPRGNKVQFEILKNDIKLVGLRKPILVNDKGEILDGNTRYRACKELIDEGIAVEIKTEVVNPSDPIAFIIAENLFRMDSSPSERAIAGLYLLNLEKERIATIENERKKGLRVDEPKSKSLDAYEIVAKKVGISSTTLKRVNKIKIENPNLWTSVKEGKQSIAQAYNTLRGKTKKVNVDRPPHTENANGGSGVAVNIPMTTVHTDLETNIPDTKMALQEILIDTEIKRIPIESRQVVGVPTFECYATTRDEAIKKLNDSGMVTKTKIEYDNTFKSIYALTKEVALQKLNPYALTEKEARTKLEASGFVYLPGFKPAI